MKEVIIVQFETLDRPSNLWRDGAVVSRISTHVTDWTEGVTQRNEDVVDSKSHKHSEHGDEGETDTAPPLAVI